MITADDIVKEAEMVIKPILKDCFVEVYSPSPIWTSTYNSNHKIVHKHSANVADNVANKSDIIYARHGVPSPRLLNLTSARKTESLLNIDKLKISSKALTLISFRNDTFDMRNFNYGEEYVEEEYKVYERLEEILNARLN
jgi:hypothetical protein